MPPTLWNRLHSLCWIVGWCIFAMSWCRLADADLLEAKAEQSTLVSRSNGPLVVVFRIASQHTGIIKGSLVGSVYSGTSLLSRVTTDELVISPGEQTIRMMLPAVDSKHGGQFGSAVIRLSFDGADLRARLGEFTLRIPGQWEQTTVIAVSNAWERRVPTDLEGLFSRYRIESWLKPNKQYPDQSLRTVVSNFSPRELPTEPLGYCGFNLLMLVREGLTELKEPQLDAIIDWVNAGGAVLVSPDDLPLLPPHQEFLNKLISAHPKKNQVIIGPGGKLLWDESNGALVGRYGLGRFVLVPNKIGDWLTNPDRATELRESVGNLWRMQTEIRTELVANGEWEVPQFDPNQPQTVVNGRWELDQFRRVRPATNQLAPIPIQSGDQLLARLIPEGMRLLPLPLVGLILMGYVLLIGPVDYFGLGFLKRRKWTWIAFPVVTIAITYATVGLSHYYMGSAKTPKGILIADIGEGNQLARTNRFQLQVSSSERTFETPITSGIYGNIDFRKYSSGGWYNNWVINQQGRNQEPTVIIPQLEGRVPSNYVVRQHLPQWSPQLNRVLHIERWQARKSAQVNTDEDKDSTKKPHGEIAPLEFDWEQFNPPTNSDTNSPPAKGIPTASIAAAVKSIPNVTSAFVVSKNDLTHIYGVRAPFRNDPRAQQTSAPYYYGGNSVVNDNDFLKNICVFEGEGLHKFVSCIAPHGGGDFDDLPLIDANSTTEWLLVICVEVGDELVVWRKLYPGR